MGSAATSRTPAPEPVVGEARRPVEPATGAELDVDDVRRLLDELRRRRRLRAQG